jgi:hypothetical protein
MSGTKASEPLAAYPDKDRAVFGSTEPALTTDGTKCVHEVASERQGTLFAALAAE